MNEPEQIHSPGGAHAGARCALAAALLVAALVGGCGGGGSDASTTTTTTTPTTTTTSPSTTTTTTSSGGSGSFQIVETSEITATLTGASPNYASSSGITLSQNTTVWAFSWSEFSAQFWAVDASNAQRLVNGQSFTGFPMAPAGQSGFNNVTLPAGTWFVGVVPNQSISSSYSNRIYAELSSVTLPGAAQVSNVPFQAARNPGGWQTQPFDVGSSGRGYIEAEAPAGKFVVMTASQASTFASTYSAGYNGGTFSFVYACGANSGGPSNEIECEMQLTPGSYSLVYINDTSSASGGAANIAFFQ